MAATARYNSSRRPAKHKEFREGLETFRKYSRGELPPVDNPTEFQQHARQRAALMQKGEGFRAVHLRPDKLRKTPKDLGKFKAQVLTYLEELRDVKNYRGVTRELVAEHFNVKLKFVENVFRQFNAEGLLHQAAEMHGHARGRMGGTAEWTSKEFHFR